MPLSGGNIPASLVDAKGDLLVASADNTVIRKAVGSDTQVLTADAASTGGIKWAAAGGGGTADGLSGKTAVGSYTAPIAGSINNTAMTLNRLTCVPFWVASSTNIDQLACEVNTGVATAVLRLGVYSDNGSGYPGALLIEATGTVDASTNGGKSLPAVATLSAGLNWLAMVSQTAAANMKYGTQLVPIPCPTITGASGNNPNWSQDSVTGALPANFTASGSFGAAQNWRIMIRAA